MIHQIFNVFSLYGNIRQKIHRTISGNQDVVLQPDAGAFTWNVNGRFASKYHARLKGTGAIKGIVYIQTQGVGTWLRRKLQWKSRCDFSSLTSSSNQSRISHGGNRLASKW